MVLVGDKKYACETCIKGHRSSNCKHTDRPLFEIKKKGRPVTQCDHCRELRKTKQVHVKCVCEQREGDVEPQGDSTPMITVTKKGKKVPASAAFPSGLPAALGASAASKPLSETSDSERELHAATCTCKATGICNCATPRASTKSKKGKSPAHGADDQRSHDGPVMAQPAALVASANGGRNRPVLPRPGPPTHSRSSPPRTVQNPTGAVQHHHPDSLYSPYSRAYEYAHGADVGAELSMSFPQSLNDQHPAQPLDNDVNFSRNETDEFSAFMNSWLANVQPSLPPSEVPPVSCDCGPNCSCPGCVIHRGPSAVAHPQGLESCANPSTCTSCMDCTMLVALENNPAFDDWVRRLGTAEYVSNPTPSIPSSAPSPPYLLSSDQHSQQFDPAMWQTYALWSNLQNQLSGPPPAEDAGSMCCSGQCKCPAGMCACPSDCCGCCTGCSCPSCEHEDRTMGTGKTLTFAVSGERASCCGRRNTGTDYSQQAGPSSAGPSMSGHGSLEFEGRVLDLRGVYEDWNASSSSTSVPRVSLSRASSSSSRSSSQQSHRSSSQGLTSGHHSDINVRSCCADMQTLSTSRPASHRSGSNSNSNSPIPPSYSPSSIEQYSGSPFDIEDGSPRIF